MRNGGWLEGNKVKKDIKYFGLYWVVRVNGRKSGNRLQLRGN
jgi:hypothetical protein